MKTTGEDRKCETCGNEFHIAAWRLKEAGGRAPRYCSRACMSAGRKGRPQSWAKPLVERKPTLRKDGYLLINSVVDGDRRRVLQHRLVMEQAIGRPLTRLEHVHHINGNRADNRLKNLRLLSNHDHQKLHDFIQTKPRGRVHLTCQRCGKTYEVKRSLATASRYCSNECRMPAMWEARRASAAERRK